MSDQTAPELATGSESPSALIATTANRTALADPLPGVETVQGVDVVAGTRQMFMPAGTDVRGTDRIKHLGRLWEIIGEPSEQISPTGELSHVEVLLKRWEGKK